MPKILEAMDPDYYHLSIPFVCTRKYARIHSMSNMAWHARMQSSETGTTAFLTRSYNFLAEYVVLFQILL